MSYTAATTTELQRINPRVEWKLELKTEFAGSNTWDEYPYTNFTLTPSTEPATLSVSLPNIPGTYSDESDQTNRLTLGAYARMTCSVGTDTGTESDVKFLGKIKTLTPQDYGFSFTALDDAADYNDHECEVTLTPTLVEVVDATSFGLLSLVDGTTDGAVLGRAFGVDSVVTYPEAFDEATGTRRRAWSPSGIRLWRDNTGTEEIAGAHWQADLQSGAMSVLENIAGKSYYIQGLSCYKESAAAGATNVDIMRLFEQAWSYPKADGGMGLSASSYAHAITAVATGLGGTISIAGDYTADFPAAKQFYVFGSSNNNGTWVVASSTYTAPNTVITVTGTVGATVDGHLNPDTGIDISGEVYFLGRVIDLIEDVQKKQQANLIVYFDSEDARHKVRLVAQRASPNEHYTLYHPKSINQGREDRDVATRVVATGQSELPANILAYNGVKVNAGDTAVVAVTKPIDAGFTQAATYQKWDKTNGGDDDTFANVQKYLYDGDHGLGMGVHGIGTSAPGLYTTWQPFAKVDMGDIRRIQRIRAKLPTSANPNQSNTSHGTGASFVYFWPGVWIQVSEDDTNWYDLAPALTKVRQAPNTLLDIGQDDITHPKCRYIRVWVGMYKQGFSNQADPSGGLMELEIFTAEEYRIVKEIYPFTHAVAVADTGSNVFKIADAANAYSANFPDESWFEVYGSTGNDAVYQCTAAAVNDGTYTIISVGTVSSAVADGSITPVYKYTDGTAWKRNHPDLYTRFAGFITHNLKLSNRYNEFLAHDVALGELAERVRLFQRVRYTAVCDPRLKMWQTVVVNDELNGNIGSILIDDSISFTQEGTVISGANYLAPPLGDV